MTENISAPFEDAKFQVGTMVSAILSGLFAYDGWDILNYGAEEIEKPRRFAYFLVFFVLFLPYA